MVTRSYGGEGSFSLSPNTLRLEASPFPLPRDELAELAANRDVEVEVCSEVEVDEVEVGSFWSAFGLADRPLFAVAFPRLIAILGPLRSCTGFEGGT